MDRMNAMDAGFLFIEDENAPMHVGAVLVFEGPAPAYGDVLRLFTAKLGDVPRHRQRVVSPPLHLGRPVWVDDEHFRVLHHVRRTALPSPGTDDRLRDLAGRIFARQLDRARPLWEVWLVEGLAGGRWALVAKLHHCMVDGVAGADLLGVVLDRRPDAEVPAPAAWTPRPAPSSLDLVVDGVRDAVLAPARHAAALPALARRLRAGSEVADLGRAVLRSLPGTARRLAVGTPRSLNGQVGPRRRWLWARAGLPEVKAIREVTGGTANDIVLAAVTRGFRDLLGERGELVPGTVVRTMVPVSVRSRAERGRLTNRVGAVLVNLPVAEPDPVRRVADLRAQLDELKASGQAAGADVLTGLGDAAAPALLALAGRAVARFPQRLLQTATTNVPGPRAPLYLLGRELTDIYPWVPLGASIRTNVGIFSYRDRITFGISADLDGVPDAQVLADGIRAGFDELTAATTGRCQRSPEGCP
ncbi:wax ester/triacylglycerol synthase family O-acyltransferase [Actinosynnema sp. NPDC050436]|uniref:WS/DGAT/MGAT family O-acyltransferase n=1 Tax=Actinosynnema sp. NPDC050436 TaxID=3155659 RepID=UPI0033CB9170